LGSQRQVERSLLLVVVRLAEGQFMLLSRLQPPWRLEPEFAAEMGMFPVRRGFAVFFCLVVRDEAVTLLLALEDQGLAIEASQERGANLGRRGAKEHGIKLVEAGDLAELFQGKAILQVERGGKGVDFQDVIDNQSLRRDLDNDASVVGAFGNG